MDEFDHSSISSGGEESDGENQHITNASDENRGLRPNRRRIKDLLEYTASKDIGELPAKKRRRARSTGQYISTGRPRGRPRKHPLPPPISHSTASPADVTLESGSTEAGSTADTPALEEYDGSVLEEAGVEEVEAVSTPKPRKNRIKTTPISLFGAIETPPLDAIAIRLGGDPPSGRSDKTSKFRGVSWDPQKRAFKARVYYGGREVCIGHFGTEDEAARARDREAARIQGHYAKLNFFSEDKLPSEPKQPESRVPISKYRGVSWQPTGAKSGMWRVRLFHEGHDYTIGYFRDEEEAGHAYDREALRLKGPACKVNFPGDIDVPVERAVKAARPSRYRDEEDDPATPASHVSNHTTGYAWPAPPQASPTKASYDGMIVTPHSQARLLRKEDLEAAQLEMSVHTTVSGHKRRFRQQSRFVEDGEEGHESVTGSSTFEDEDEDVSESKEFDLSDDVVGQTLLMLATGNA